MQASHARSMGETGMNVLNRVSASAAMMHRAPLRVVSALPFVDPIAAELTLAQRVARYGLTAFALLAMSALFASQVAATLH